MPRKKKLGGRPKIPMIAEDLGEDGLYKNLPHKPLCLEEIIYWLDLGATAEEIAGSFRVSVSTVERRLKECYGVSISDLKSTCAGTARLSLRKNQINLSRSNAAMCIWLGKQWLGQTDDKNPLEAFGGELKEFIDFLKEKSRAIKDQQNAGSEREAEICIPELECQDKHT